MDFFISAQPRGLHNFISEIRHCKSKDEERMRIDKELGNIRLKFSKSAALTAYDKKKYVWKMCYIYMLGYDVDFGHSEFISLIGSTKYQEKTVGYMAVSLLIRPGDELLTLVINSMRNDLLSNVNSNQCLALSVVANLGGVELAEALGADIQRLLIDKNSGTHGYQALMEGEAARNETFFKKKALLCLLQLFRFHPDIVDLDDWVTQMGRFLEDRDMGVLTSAMSLVPSKSASTMPLFLFFFTLFF
jgi:AP-2 complex subunit alpha